MLRSILVFIILFFLSGCGTSLHVVPELEDLSLTPDFNIVGSIDYSGNAEYLPRTIKQSDDKACDLIFKYLYDVGYGKDAIPEVLPLFNPLSMVGFPIGQDSIIVVGHLNVTKNGKMVKKYNSTCVIDKTRSLFYEGKTHSELRKKGLLTVRNNIEIQMLSDRETLLSFTN